MRLCPGGDTTGRSSGGEFKSAHEEVLVIALAASETSRLDLNNVWNGRQPLWFACRTGNHRAAHALMSASGAVKPALTTEVKFKLDLKRHHTTLQAAAASGDESMLKWLLTWAQLRTTNQPISLIALTQVPRRCEGAGAGHP